MNDQAPLTLMAVHAHPDDEASSTGGILAQYSDAGINTVVVTCTNGEMGDGPEGVKPGEPGHDPAAVVAVRLGELRRSCSILGVKHLELLGYHDSGMVGWPQNEAPESFWNIPVEVAARPLVRLMEQYRPQVVVTYDANGFYGHPDHIQAHRITVAAVAATGIPAKLYFPAFPRSALPLFAEMMTAAGLQPPELPSESDFGVPDEEITSRVDVNDVIDRKHAALAAHASQTENTFFLKLGMDLFKRAFGQESFVRHLDNTGAPVPEDDLFAGLR
jgi:LmbE family N-acetylglucosaminyl deacetylase